MSVLTPFVRSQAEPERLRLIGADLEVPVSGGRLVTYANFDYAASAPCLEPVKAAVDAALPAYSNVHRGAGYTSQLTTARYEQARNSIKVFAQARPDDTVIFTRNTTDALNLLSRSLPAATAVIVFETEHHASLLAWGECALRLPSPESPGAAIRAADLALAEAPPGPKLLVVTAASNVTGELWPIAELAAVAHAREARIAVDAAQLAPHRPLRLAQLDLDYVAFSGHKLYAPFGAGVLIGRADWLATARPYLLGGGASRAVEDDHVEWADDAEHRHEAGTPNVLGAIALAAACDALGATWDETVPRERRLLDRLRTGLAEIPGVRELSLWGSDRPRVGIVTFAADRLPARDLAEALSGRYGIGVRDGKFCAHPLVRHLLGGSGGPGGCDDDAGTAVRASIGLGTTQEHVDRLLTALRALVAAESPI